jgi:glycosyltransferase involved in cell wall biosynthesis
MKVAIDTAPLNSGHAVRGVGVNTRELIDSLIDETKKPKNTKTKKQDTIRIFPVDFTKTDLFKYDLIHYTAFNPYFPSIPEKKQAKKVILTIHDLIYLIYPDKYPSGIKGRLNFTKNKKRLKNVDCILTITETSKKDIVRLLNFPPEKVKVIHLAAASHFKKTTNIKRKNDVRKKYGLPDKFILYVGDVNYNKNIPNLIKASKLSKTPLLIVGKQAAEMDDLDSLKSIKGLRDYWRFLRGVPHPEVAHASQIRQLINKNNVATPGFVPEDDLVTLYNLASVYVQPAFYEGFGLPVLEAFSCGTPVVISRTNALVEIAADAALVADPHSPEDMAKKIQLLKGNSKLRNQLVEKGLKRAREFSWRKTAKKNILLYLDVGRGNV